MYCACIFPAINPISVQLKGSSLIERMKVVIPTKYLFPCTQGQVQVELCSEANDWPDEKVMELLKRSENIVAVESPAYFRAYQPVLEALKRIDISKIHFM